MNWMSENEDSNKRVHLWLFPACWVLGEVLWMYFFVYYQNSLCRRCLIICFIVKEIEAKRGCKTCLKHMASECGDWIGGQAVLASAAEISCERPGPPLSIQIKPRRNMNSPIQALWCIEAENRKASGGGGYLRGAPPSPSHICLLAQHHTHQAIAQTEKHSNPKY